MILVMVVLYVTPHLAQFKILPVKSKEILITMTRNLDHKLFSNDFKILKK
jgi:hypothetical protein